MNKEDWTYVRNSIIEIVLVGYSYKKVTKY